MNSNLIIVLVSIKELLRRFKKNGNSEQTFFPSPIALSIYVWLLWKDFMSLIIGLDCIVKRMYDG